VSRLKSLLSLILGAGIVYGATGNMAAQAFELRQRTAAREADGNIGALVAGEVRRLHLPGYALAVIKGGDVVFSRGYGFADLRMRTPVTPDTVFDLASVTKTFTGMVLLKLVDEKKLGLDDPLGTYVSNLPETWNHLTIRQLATMTAGVPGTLKNREPWPNEIQYLVKQPLLWSPGGGYEYSNSSYNLLGSVIESVTAKSYLQAVKETVLQPLGMNVTSGVDSFKGGDRLARGYAQVHNGPMVRPVRYPDGKVSFAAGMLCSNLNDMTQFVLGMLHREILTPSGYETMWFNRPLLNSGQASNWAFGWGSRKGPGGRNGRIVTMNGGVPGAASTVIIQPDKGNAVIALSNMRNPDVYKIAQKVARMVFKDGGGIKNAENADEAPGGDQVEIELRNEHSSEEN
jgi:CubicO group peptidase (beta-lactamase class C family)